MEIGARHKTKNHGYITILSEIKRDKYNRPTFLVEFEDTKYRTHAHINSIRTGSVKDKTNSFSIELGARYPTKHCGLIQVIVRISGFVHKGPNAKYKIKFINTGYELDVDYSAIRSGEIKDPYYPIVHGIGYYGTQGKFNDCPLEKKLYLAWYMMLSRCYNPKNKAYAMYGGNGVSVDQSWHSYLNFRRDALALPIIGASSIMTSRIALDKDYLQEDTPSESKVYSKNTCCFLASKLNSALTSTKNTTSSVKAIFSDGTLKSFDSIKACSEETGVDKVSIHKVLRGDRQKAKGIKFEYIKQKGKV